MKILKRVDRAVRVAIRRVLHLPKTCADAYLHAPVKLGGLGIMEMSLSIPAILRRRITSITNKASRTTAATLSLHTAEHLWNKLMRWTSTNGGSSAVIARLQGDRLDVGYSGNGINQGRADPSSGNWVFNPPPYWSGYDYVRAVKLRGNLLPTKGIPSNPPHERRCRMGCERSETLCHVLQKCPAGHWARIRRHDQIVSLVRKVAEKRRWIVEVEPRIRCTDGALKIPDLVLTTAEDIVVVDVAISWEGPASLSVAYENKRAIYSELRFIETIRRQYPGKTIRVVPFILGARGTWCSENKQLSDILTFTNQDKNRFITETIQGSLKIHRHFMNLA